MLLIIITSRNIRKFTNREMYRHVSRNNVNHEQHLDRKISTIHGFNSSAFVSTALYGVQYSRRYYWSSVEFAGISEENRGDRFVGRHAT